MRTDTCWLGFDNKYSINAHWLGDSGSRGAPLPQAGSVGWGCQGNSRGMMQSTHLWVFSPLLLMQPRGQGDTIAEPAAGLDFQGMSLWSCWLGLWGVTGPPPATTTALCLQLGSKPILLNRTVTLAPALARAAEPSGSSQASITHLERSRGWGKGHGAAESKTWCCWGRGGRLRGAPVCVLFCPDHIGCTPCDSPAPDGAGSKSTASTFLTSCQNQSIPYIGKRAAASSSLVLAAWEMCAGKLGVCQGPGSVVFKSKL